MRYIYLMIGMISFGLGFIRYGVSIKKGISCH